MSELLLLLKELLLFLLVVYFCFYLPGKLLWTVLSIRFGFSTVFFLPLVTGMLLFTLGAYVFSWINLPFVGIALLFLVDLITIKLYGIKKKSVPTQHRIPLIIVLTLSLIFSLPVTLSGVWGNTILHQIDDLAHLGYISELKHAFPPQHPGFAGVPLRGYHFFYDFLLAKTSSLSTISQESLYFHFFPLLIGLLWGVGIYSLLFTWTKRIAAALWGVLLCLFGGSFGYFLWFFGHRNIAYSSIFGIDQPATALYNAPFSFSIVIVIGALLLFYAYLQNHSRSLLLPIVLFVGLAPMFKIYGGMLLLGGFGLLIFYEIVKKRFTILFAAAGVGILVLGTFGVLAGKGASLFFLPLWPVYRMMQSNIPWYGFDEKIYTYSRQSVIRGLVETYTFSFFLFLIGNLGTRICGILILLIKGIITHKKPSFFSFIVFAMTIAAVGIPLFFAQTIKVFDMIQMTWYYVFLASLFAAVGFGSITDWKISKGAKVSLTIILLLATLPAASEQLSDTLGHLITVKRYSLSNTYFQTMNFLTSHGRYTDTLIVIPDISEVSNEAVMKWYETTGLDIPAFGNKRGYLLNQYITFPNMDVPSRVAFLARVAKLARMNEYDTQYNQLRQEVIHTLQEEHIVFVLAQKPLQFLHNEPSTPLLYHNKDYFLYKIQ